MNKSIQKVDYSESKVNAKKKFTEKRFNKKKRKKKKKIRR